MKILFISDIHGVITNLNVIRNHKFDKLVLLGDLYSSDVHTGMNNDNNEVDRLINEYNDKILCVKGNCDYLADYQRLEVAVSNDYLKITDEGLDIYCTHGDGYNYHKLSFLGTGGVIIYGHEHCPYIEKVNDVVHICVGSISKPRYGSKASYCIYENKEFIIYSVDGEIIDFINI